jgi:tripartite-type tricarboxylate transporter receptor subunit TctC
MLTRRAFAAATLALPAARTALAQGTADYPSRPVRLIIPFAPGGSTDIVARILAAGMQEAFGGRPVVAENRGGASGALGAEALVSSPADGHAILIATISNGVLLAGFSKNPRLDPRKTFAPVSLVATLPMVLTVNNDVPARTLPELIELMRARPNGLNYGSAGPGSLNHLGSALLNTRTGTQSVHVPYRGSGPVFADLISGNIHWFIEGIPAQTPFVNSGQVRALAVLAPERNTLLPNVPTAREQGVDFDIINFMGIFTAAGTPAPLIAQQEAAIRQAVANPVTASRLKEAGTDPAGSTTAEFKTFWEAQLAQWLPVAEASGVRID